jgi:hypothetical protein
MHLLQNAKNARWATEIIFRICFSRNTFYFYLFELGFLVPIADRTSASRVTGGAYDFR